MTARGKYTMRAAARLSGLTPETIRAWERRYGAVEPDRSPGAHRLYTEPEVERLALLRRVVEAGHGIGAVARLPVAELEALLGPPAPATPRGDTVERVLAAVRTYDFQGADRELALAASLFPPRQLVLEVASPLMARVGDLWAAGELAVGQEHLVSGLVRTLLGTLMRLATPVDGRAPLVLATLGGEQHELGLLMVGLLACSRQVPVCYLGPGAPVEEIVQVAARTRAAAVGVGVVHVTDAAAVARDLERLARQLGKVALWAGGAGLGALDGQALPRRMLRIQGIAELDAALEELLAAR